MLATADRWSSQIQPIAALAEDRAAITTTLA